MDSSCACDCSSVYMYFKPILHAHKWFGSKWGFKQESIQTTVGLSSVKGKRQEQVTCGRGGETIHPGTTATLPPQNRVSGIKTNEAGRKLWGGEETGSMISQTVSMHPWVLSKSERYPMAGQCIKSFQPLASLGNAQGLQCLSLMHNAQCYFS